MLKTLKAVLGVLAGMFCLAFLRLMARHLALLGAPHQMDRLVVDGGWRRSADTPPSSCWRGRSGPTRHGARGGGRDVDRGDDTGAAGG